MSKVKELFEEISKDEMKDAGSDVTMEEIQTCFMDIEKETNGEVSEEELDSVAGGALSILGYLKPPWIDDSM